MKRRRIVLFENWSPERDWAPREWTPDSERHPLDWDFPRQDSFLSPWFKVPAGIRDAIFVLCVGEMEHERDHIRLELQGTQNRELCVAVADIRISMSHTTSEVSLRDLPPELRCSLTLTRHAGGPPLWGYLDLLEG